MCRLFLIGTDVLRIKKRNKKRENFTNLPIIADKWNFGKGYANYASKGLVATQHRQKGMQVRISKPDRTNLHLVYHYKGVCSILSQ